MFEDVKYPEIFSFFREISNIPRGSGNEKAIADYLVEFAKKRDLFCHRDEVNNVLIRKSATDDSLTKRPAVVLQGHTDMVCEAAAGVKHDFLKDPIQFIRNGDVLTAAGTTLGADNGCAVAVMLAILDADDIKHPDLECLFTVGEEVGMDGMTAFDTSLLKSRKMINLDSAGEGVATVACAGGVRCDFEFKPEIAHQSDELTFYKVKVFGLYGGHSGEDINLGRSNAIEATTRILRFISNDCCVYLSKIRGGDKDNAIPRDCEAVFAVSDIAKVETNFNSASELIRHELVDDDSKFSASIEKIVSDKQVITATDSQRIIDFLSLFKSGPAMMSRNIPDMVETSYNLAVINCDTFNAHITVSFRSSVESALDDMTYKMEAIGRASGFRSNCHGRYPGWNYSENSPLRELYLSTWKDLTGKNGVAIGIHAGLECGLLKKKVPDMDIISIGPDIKDLHSPSESLGIGSFDRLYETVLKMLEKMLKTERKYKL